ncbi:MAG: type IV pilin, partial [Halanaeroarchaeum sp.]
GTFVLGLGENVSQSTPQAQLTLSTTGNNITITHKGGDPITASSIKVKVENTSTGGSTLLFTPGNNTKLTVGDTATVNTSATSNTSKLIWPNGEEPDSVFTDGDTAFTGGLKTGVTYHVTVIHKDSQQLIADQDVIA